MKIKTVCIILVMCFLLAACGGKSAAPKTNNSKSVSATSEPIQSNISESENPWQSENGQTGTSGNKSTPTPAVTHASPTAIATFAPIPTPSKAPTPAPTKKPNTVSVCIPEGYSASQIGDVLQKNGVCKKADFLSTMNSYNFTYYSLVGAIPNNPNRCYTLEGYLFPDTYQFYINMKPQDAIGKMLRSAQNHVAGYEYSGMTTYQVITLASMIEKEAGDANQLKKISSVFHNRLKLGMKLQADSTINYIEMYVKPNLTGDINRYNAYYNTYKCAALPAGPICNPGAKALDAAAHPDNTDYLYFVADKQGSYYAATYEEHVKNCELAGIPITK